MRKLLIVFFFVAVAALSFGQGSYIPLGSDAYGYVSRLDIKYGKILPVEFTSDKGYERGKVAKMAETLLLSNLQFNKVERAELQYLLDECPEWLDSLHSKTRRPLWKKLYTEPASFYSVSSKKKGLFDLRLNPIIGVTVGGESEAGRFLFNRSVGLEARGNIKQVLSFYFNATGNDERDPAYATYLSGNATTSPNQYAYLPGEGYYKPYASKIFKFNDGFDFFDARGYVKANILKYIDLSFGRDKFFIGDGQRSLILSDFSAPFLFLKFDVHFWRFRYENIFGQLVGQYPRNGLTQPTDALLPTKYMAVHHLSLDCASWLTLGLFETVIFERNQFDFAYLNPIIFYKAVEASLGNGDKVSLGGDFKINFAHHVQIYGQALLNEFNTMYFFKGDGYWSTKYALQVGVKYIDIAPNLDAQIEFNVVKPFTYTADATDNFTNYNQPLVDPLGASFYEFRFNLHYHPISQLQFNLLYWVARVGGDTLINGALTNYGNDILQPVLVNGSNSATMLFGNHIAQGATATINYFEFLITYQPWHNINFDMSLLYRSEPETKSINNPNLGNSSFIFNIGMRINLRRRTLDF